MVIFVGMWAVIVFDFHLWHVLFLLIVSVQSVGLGGLEGLCDPSFVRSWVQSSGGRSVGWLVVDIVGYMGSSCVVGMGTIA